MRPSAAEIKEIVRLCPVFEQSRPGVVIAPQIEKADLPVCQDEILDETDSGRRRRSRIKEIAADQYGSHFFVPCCPAQSPEGVKELCAPSRCRGCIKIGFQIRIQMQITAMYYFHDLKNNLMNLMILRITE